ncbi:MULTISPECIES: hypothetical protein [Peribacillus]|uniref:hypothetical protein n=1 Tax=Peribacillus TaxID=2675229 RepID=UPI0024E210CA|nr:hypothetical protein [Peribacillus simplex]MDF9761930.1 hypothetical protein [Peribacillus simplex]
MEPIKIEDIQPLVSEKASVAILDDGGQDKASFVTKTIVKVELCPDITHLRIYFDDINFFAVPLKSILTKSVNEWVAFDENSGLQYIIRRESGQDV